MAAKHQRDLPDETNMAVKPASPLKPVRRPFPGPREAAAALRVAIDRRAQAELVAHAKESLDLEVCGVLAGQVGEDQQGLFVHVEAIIRGNAATQAATHVTFTQATWDAIHETLEREYPKLRIVGWYHTHPGFGVEFSEMDVFIQRNFFSGPAQIAFVTDPTNGAVAIAMTTPTGIEYLPRYWVDGREQAAKCGPGAAPAGSDSAVPAPGDLSQAVKSLEARVSQLIQAQDDQRTLVYRLVLTVGMVFCAAILGTAAYFMYSQYSSRYEPPHVSNYVPVPIKVGDKTVLVGVGIVDWEVPPEVNALLVELEKQKRADLAKAAAAGQIPEPPPAKPDLPHEPK